MTDWTTVDLNNLLPGEPWTSGKALAVYENPIALAEGATGAPRSLTASFGTLLQTVDPAGLSQVVFSSLVYDRYIIQFDGIRYSAGPNNLNLTVITSSGTSGAVAINDASGSTTATSFSGWLDYHTNIRNGVSYVSPDVAALTAGGVDETLLRGAPGTERVTSIVISWAGGATFNAASGQVIRLYSTSLGVAP